MHDSFLRPATLKDAQFLFDWVTSEDSLKWKRQTQGSISSEGHNAWLESQFEKKMTQIWIIVLNKVPSGQVRLEKKNDTVYIDIYVVEKARRTGVASRALNASIKRYTESFGDQRYCAIVHRNNTGSQNLFIKNGFQQKKAESSNWLKFLPVVT